MDRCCLSDIEKMKSLIPPRGTSGSCVPNRSRPCFVGGGRHGHTLSRVLDFAAGMARDHLAVAGEAAPRSLGGRNVLQAWDYTHGRDYSRQHFVSTGSKANLQVADVGSFDSFQGNTSADFGWTQCECPGPPLRCQRSRLRITASARDGQVTWH